MPKIRSNEGRIHVQHIPLKKLLVRIQKKTNLDMTIILTRIVSENADAFTTKYAFKNPSLV